MLFNKVYERYYNYGNKVYFDLLKKRNGTILVLRQISQKFMSDPELNVVDLAQYLDSRVTKMPMKLTPFYDCNSNDLRGKSCSNLSDLFKANMADILGVMKWILQPLGLIIPKIEFDLEQGNVMSQFGYLLTDTSTISNPLLFNCDHGANIEGLEILPFQKPNVYEKTFGECLGFFRTYTDAGIGYSYNTATFWDNYKYNDGLSPFFKVMQPKGNDEVFEHIAKNMSSSQAHVLRSLFQKVLHPKSSGPKYGLKLYVSSDTLDHGPIKLQLHSPYEPANIEGSALELTHGMRHTIYVTPKKTTTEHNLKSLPYHTRGCLFENENHGPQRLFNNYTRQSCLFECSLSQAYEHCGCIPWDFPHFEKSAKLCLRGEDKCFRKWMKNSQSELSCQCPSSCNHIDYAYSVVSTPLDIYDMPLCNFLYDARQPNNMMFLDQVYDPNNRRIKFPWSWVESDPKEKCQETVSYVAVINIQLTSDTITEIVRRRRVTFTDQLSNLGNLLLWWH